MKVNKILLSACVTLLFILSLSSCKRSGYGCPYEMKQVIKIAIR